MIKLTMAEAEAKLAAAKHEHQEEIDGVLADEMRLGKTREEIASIGESIRTADPDDAPKFGRLTASRDAAKGRCEALEERLRARRAKVQASEAAVSEAARTIAALKFEVARVEVEEINAALGIYAIECCGKLAQLAARLREKYREASTLHGEAQIAEAFPEPEWHSLKPLGEPGRSRSDTFLENVGKKLDSIRRRASNKTAAEEHARRVAEAVANGPPVPSHRPPQGVGGVAVAGGTSSAEVYSAVPLAPESLA